MKVWQFSEQAYHPAFEVPGAMRVNLPSHHCDPVEAGALINRYLDEYMLADQLGYNIMINEHHAAATCMSTSCMTTLAILARQTQNARLLALGIPIANRSNPVRVAEEIAMVDAISGGRLEVGLVKGAAYEVFMSNRLPNRFVDRFWETHDLILAALTNRGDNFSWDSENFHYRVVSLWPRPIQDPHPPIWMTASSANSAAPHAKLDYNCATFLSGAVARSVFDGYRKSYSEAHGRLPSDDKLAYLAIVSVADDRKKAFERAEEMKSYFTTAARLDPQFRNPAGFNPWQVNVKMAQAGPFAIRPRLRDGSPLPSDPTIEQYIDAGLMFVGTPDDVFKQIAQFYSDVGGFGNLLMMGQAGTLSHEDTVENLTLFSKEVMPRLKELSAEGPEVRYEAFA
ncbi:LLM class flavin-dependent oxidoreductase [Hyphococcus luteus]|uniref:LLM class flavin-dependent oxidoreductase n=1 Tax=Hyphococcus luteus TaxID=2058213 RepID=A0A2S7K1K9_9PROT|nr:LLM class flavin-dependent oxidoreductase [Marinicaulis flavus]PQA86395.1 LLM class flavin-dependent oxidoreductase [Marinicaulis flavus]